MRLLPFLACLPSWPDYAPTAGATDSALAVADTDGDGDGFSETEGDCDDTNAAVNPQATDVVGDDIDQNCDGVDGTDWDGDGHASEGSGGDDCDDSDSEVSPDGTEVAYDSVDQDCDGADFESWIAVSAGASIRTCGIRANMEMACWGGPGEESIPDLSGQKFDFVVVANPATDLACAIADDGSASCWGSASGEDIEPPDGHEFIKLDASNNHICGLTSANEIVCWGSGLSGQGTVPAGTYTDMAVGVNFSCGLDGGDIACWGEESNIPTLNGTGFYSSFDAGDRSVCALTEPGEIDCWLSTTEPTGPSDPPPGAFTALSVGGRAACALDTEGEIACWGYGDNGSTTPPAGAFVALSLGRKHGCAIDGVGALACWGASGSEGELEPPPWGGE